jgi:multimeric flavodoxin WrbA
MKITVLNGSPKGENSVTMQYVRYMEKNVPGFETGEFLVTRDIAGLERNPAKLAEVADAMADSDAVIFAVPAYHFTVPGQFVRFVELLDSAGLSSRLSGKPFGVVVTSIHFYDHMVVRWLRLAGEDRGMRFVDALSPLMTDLLAPGQQANIRRWGEEFLRSVSAGEFEQPVARSASPESPEFRPAGIVPASKNGKARVVVLADSQELPGNLGKMVEVFAAASENEVEVLDIRSSGIRGGCTGCCGCGYDNTCSYTDGFSNWYIEKVRNADAVIMAAKISNRGWGSFWKTFHDRTFFLNHRRELLGKQYGCLVSGSLANNPNFREELEARAEVWGANPCGIVDDALDSPSVESTSAALARKIDRNVLTGYRKPETFLGAGGMKIFRDFIYLDRFVFHADDKHYRKIGAYDFPQKNLMFRIVNFIMVPLLAIPGFRKGFRKMMPKQMAAPLRAVVQKSGK